MTNTLISSIRFTGGVSAAPPIDIHEAGKSDELSNDQIVAQLQAYDRGLPDSYRALAGSSGMSDPNTRYAQQTRDEALGGPVQTE